MSVVWPLPSFLMSVRVQCNEGLEVLFDVRKLRATGARLPCSILNGFGSRYPKRFEICHSKHKNLWLMHVVHDSCKTKPRKNSFGLGAISNRRFQAESVSLYLTHR